MNKARVYEALSLCLEGGKEMSFQDIAVECEPPLAIVKLNRPEVRNAVRPQTAKDLMKAFKQLDSGLRRSPSMKKAS